MLSGIFRSLDRKRKKHKWMESQVKWIRSSSARWRSPGRNSFSPAPRPPRQKVLKVSPRQSLLPRLTHTCLQLALATNREDECWACAGFSRCRSGASSFVAYKLILMTKDPVFHPELWLGTLGAAAIAVSWIKVPSETLDPEEQEKVNPVKQDQNETRKILRMQLANSPEIASTYTALRLIWHGYPAPGTSTTGWE